MFLKTKKEEKFFSLREKFIKELNEKLQEQNFKDSEKRLRTDLMKKIKSGRLF